MEITWLGHACFRIRGRDVTLVTDPYEGGDWGYPPLSTAAGVVSVSHEHPHHAYVAAVSGSPYVLRGPGEYEIGGAIIWGVRTPRKSASDDGVPARNTSYVFQLEDLSICHLGDLGGSLSTDQLTHIKDCDILMVPVGGACTIGAAEAAEVIAQIEPKIIIPMHYGRAEMAADLGLSPVERFCKEMGATDVASQPRLNVSASSLPAEPTVVLLDARI